MKNYLGIWLVVFVSGCATGGLALKQDAVLGLQVSETSLEGAHSIERGLCFNVPATESGPVCTNPIAATVGLTKIVDDPDSKASPKAQISVHQLLARYFDKGFTAEITAGSALLLWKAGDPPPQSVSDYQSVITQILNLVKTLLPNQTDLLTKIQLAVDTGAKVATAVGVK